MTRAPTRALGNLKIVLTNLSARFGSSSRPNAVHTPKPVESSPASWSASPPSRPPQSRRAPPSPVRVPQDPPNRSRRQSAPGGGGSLEASTVPLWLIAAPSVVAVVAIVAAELRDRRRLTHEKEMRLRDERIAAYRKLLAATTTAHVERSGVDALTAAHAEIALLASTDEIDGAAAEVKLAYWQKQKRSYRETQDLDAPASESAQALRKAEAARNRFLTLAW